MEEKDFRIASILCRIKASLVLSLALSFSLSLSFSYLIISLHSLSLFSLSLSLSFFLALSSPLSLSHYLNYQSHAALTDTPSQCFSQSLNPSLSLSHRNQHLINFPFLIVSCNHFYLLLMNYFNLIDRLDISKLDQVLDWVQTHFS